MRELRLLERILYWETEAAPSATPSADLLVGSVLSHLRRILNTRRGSASIDPNFGMPDFTNVAGSTFSGSSVRELEMDLVGTIRKYEPRLRNPTLKMVPDERDILALKFELGGTIQMSERDVQIHLAAVVNADGRVKVTR